MDKQMMIEIKPLLDLVYNLIDENEHIDNALNGVQDIAIKQRQRADETQQKLDKVKKENHSLQTFIEEHVSEEKKKLIFN